MSLQYRKALLHGTKLGLIMSVLHVQLTIFLIVQLRTDHQRDHDYVYIYIVWMLFGLIAATYRLIRERESEEPPSVGEVSPLRSSETRP
jgi:Na+/melibiose symporter-like transporter